LPVTLGLVSAGIGGVQALIGGIKGRKARKEMENLQTPQYQMSKSITDYYNQALNRYQQSPTASNLYKMQSQNIARGTAQGLSSFQDRRSGLGGVSALIQGQNDAQLKALAASEQDQNQKFSQLGAASNAMAGEERQAFNINKMLPYQRKADLLQQKAAGNAQLMNAGLQNVYGGLTGAVYGSALKSPKTPSTSTPDYSERELQGDERLKPFTAKTFPY
jgi:hypothetical protein